MKKAILFFGLFFGIIASAQNRDGDSINQGTISEINQIPDYEIVKTKIDLKDVVTKADQLPEFPGGIEKFKKRFFESLKSSDSKKKKANDTRLYFIVEKTGYIKSFTAVGSNKSEIKEAETAIKGVFERWKPALVNGQAVRYLIYFPLEGSNSSIENKNISEKTNNVGADKGLTTSGIPDLEYVKSKIDIKDAVTNADEKPEFPGGMDAFKRKYFESIETLDLKNNEKVDTRLYFVVEKTGYVRNVVAVGSNKKHVEAAESGVRGIFARWKPAKLGGKPVRYLFYFPLTSKKY
ncbi:MAG TPA: hypothetical protein VF455_10905 [Chryseobacterium sp.]